MTAHGPPITMPCSLLSHGGIHAGKRSASSWLPAVQCPETRNTSISSIYMTRSIAVRLAACREGSKIRIQRTAVLLAPAHRTMHCQISKWTSVRDIVSKRDRENKLGLSFRRVSLRLLHPKSPAGVTALHIRIHAISINIIE